MLPHGARRKADIVFSSFLVLLGVYLIYAASRMPWTSARTGGAAQWYLSPGLYPAILGGLLIIFSIRVLVAAIGEVGVGGIGTTFIGWVKRLPRNGPVQRVVFMMALVGAYIFFGIGFVDFRIVSAVFLFLFIGFFWWPGAGPALIKRIAITLVISVGVPAAMAYIFTTYLFVPMP